MAFWDIVTTVGATLLDQAQQSAEQQSKQRGPLADSPAYQHGREGIKTAFVLSAPGQAEQKAGKPAAGQTGKTINRVLKVLNQSSPEIFPSTDKNDYRIVNAVADVHFKKATGRTEGTRSEVNDRANKKRLDASLAGMKYVAALGEMAKTGMESSKFGGTVFKESHPSFQNLNRNISAKGNSPQERSEARIAEYANRILKSKQ